MITTNITHPWSAVTQILRNNSSENLSWLFDETTGIFWAFSKFSIFNCLISPNPCFQSIFFCTTQIGIFCVMVVWREIGRPTFLSHDLWLFVKHCLLRVTVFNYHRSDTLLGLRNIVEHHRCHFLYKWIHELFNIKP